VQTRLPAKAGFARAMQMSLLGERISAEQALDWGLINFVVDDAALRDEAGALVERLAAGPTRSYAGTKRQLNARVYAGIEQQLELEAQIQHEQAATSDFVEGVTAFAQRRPAVFEGR
jgi:2-(1,2-epoxy-1,2-dihydrophenyl)acetyl-CoA isomerase